jgi:hypothetical protein
MSVTMPKQSSDPNKVRPLAPSGGDSPLKNLLLGVFLTGIGGLLLAISRRPKGAGGRRHRCDRRADPHHHGDRRPGEGQAIIC